MKKLMLGVALVVAPALSFAGTDAGCGAGSMIFKGQSGPAPHILAATTNGSFGNQTFGMTSGTLGCDTSKPVTSTASTFMNNNIDRVAQDMSRGEGEMLSTLSVLMGVESSDRAAFNKLAKDHFAALYPNETVTGDDVLAGLVELMKQDAQLAKYVG